MTHIVPFPLRDETKLIIDHISEAIISHMNLLQTWHRSVICNAIIPQEILDEKAHLACSLGCWLDQHQYDSLLQQPVFEDLIIHHNELHHKLQQLAHITADGGHVTGSQYDELGEKMQNFVKAAQRITEAFRLVAELDPLTGLYNRHSMAKDLNREREIYIRTDVPFCVALADIDHFKKINDTHGHGVGDMILATIANYFISHVRPYDAIFRFGGEEFLILFPHTSLEEGKAALDRLRVNISKLTLASNDHIDLRVTVSFGLAQISDDISVQDLIERADLALYKAKKEGRNRVCVWQAKYKREAELVG